MPVVTTKDGVEIFYKDWGQGHPIVFSHGWPLSADDWDAQLLFFLGKGYRVIAHDRRGHGRSTQTGDGHDMDHYADDLAAVTGHLDLKDVIHIGHSTGGGEVVHYLARHGEDRVAKAAIISAVPPRPGVKTIEPVVWNWWRQGMMGGAKAHYDGIVAFSQTDFTEDLKKIAVPVLV